MSKRNTPATVAALAAAVLAGGEMKAHIRRSQVTPPEPKKVKPSPQMPGHSLADAIRRAKTTEEVKSLLLVALDKGADASAKTKLRWTRAANARLKVLES